MRRFLITFRYADAYSRWEWREQQGSFSGNDPEEALRKCKEIYGLGVDCEYQIIAVEEIK